MNTRKMSAEIKREPIGVLIKRLREEKGLSQRKLEQISGINRGYICQLEAGKAVGITIRTARALAKGLGVSPEIFLKPDGAELPLVRSPEVALRDLEVSIKAYIPVYAEVSAGEGMMPIDYVAVTRAKPAPETLRAYRVKGLCLETEVRDGDTIIVDTAMSPTNGDLVVCIIDGQASVKRYKEDGHGNKWLENQHGKYQPEDVHLHGIVTQVVHNIR